MVGKLVLGASLLLVGAQHTIDVFVLLFDHVEPRLLLISESVLGRVLFVLFALLLRLILGATL